jgi:uncharacterized membrane protein YhaH (DUF805 family)
VTFTQAIKSGFVNYFNFRSRAMASEFWWWQLFVLLSTFAISLLDSGLGFERIGITGIWYLATLTPGLAIAVRRLQDADMSGWWLLTIFIPLVGFMLVIWWIGEGTPGYNRFGADPQPKDVSRHALGQSLLRARTDTAN